MLLAAFITDAVSDIAEHLQQHKQCISWASNVLILFSKCWVRVVQGAH